MDDINPIYTNEFGLAFQWRENANKDMSKVQVVFKDMGLFLSKDELVHFSKNIVHAMETSPLQCKDCQHQEPCRKALLETPASQVTLALTTSELLDIKDLVEGTLFQLNLNSLLDTICS